MELLSILLRKPRFILPRAELLNLESKCQHIRSLHLASSNLLGDEFVLSNCVDAGDGYSGSRGKFVHEVSIDHDF